MCLTRTQVKYVSLIAFILLLIWYVNRVYRTFEIYNSNQLLSVEGYVKDFHEMLSSGHDSERFRIDTVNFEFSDYHIYGFGYNNAKSNGGAVDENAYLRIKYYKLGDSNVILKLEKRK